MPALVGLAGMVLVAAAPQNPGVAVGLVAAGPGDDGSPELPEQFGNGGGYQFQGGGTAVAGACIDLCHCRRADMMPSCEPRP
jgi:hypothetical protein